MKDIIKCECHLELQMVVHCPADVACACLYVGQCQTH